MKLAILGAALTLFNLFILPFQAQAEDVYVNGYYRSNGTYVQPHYRSAPDGDRSNNWSTQGNYNPYTGKPGTVSPNSYNSNPGVGANYGTYQNKNSLWGN